MGGSKSKPIVDSARQVLAKRSAEAEAVKSVASRGDSMNMKIDLHYTPEVRINTQPEGYEIDQDIVREMSTWTTVKETTKGTQVELYHDFFT